jgi:hypothetical protein
MGAPGRGECLAEQNIAILAALALVDEDFAVFQVNFGNFHPAQLGDPDPGVEDQPEYRGVLDIFGPIQNLVEMPKFVSGQNPRELRGFFIGPKFA